MQDFKYTCRFSCSLVFFVLSKFININCRHGNVATLDTAILLQMRFYMGYEDRIFQWTIYLTHFE
jgi:hypothetical protein